MNVTCEIKKDGDKLTGTCSTDNGVYEKNPIKDGKIDGNNVSFNIKAKFRGMKITDKFTGTFFGDTLQLTLISKVSSGRGSRSAKRLQSTEYPPNTFTVKRVE